MSRNIYYLKDRYSYYCGSEVAREYKSIDDRGVKHYDWSMQIKWGPKKSARRYFNYDNALAMKHNIAKKAGVILIIEEEINEKNKRSVCCSKRTL